MTPDILTGKYFLAPGWRLGVVESAIGDAHYLVRINEGKHGLPEHLIVVALSTMLGGDGEYGPLPWFLFDDHEQRAKFCTWVKEPSPDDPTKPRVVSMR
jgi:hypothetical protein